MPWFDTPRHVHEQPNTKNIKTKKHVLYINNPFHQNHVIICFLRGRLLQAINFQKLLFGEPSSQLTFMWWFKIEFNCEPNNFEFAISNFFESQPKEVLNKEIVPCMNFVVAEKILSVCKLLYCCFCPKFTARTRHLSWILQN